MESFWIALKITLYNMCWRKLYNENKTVND
jgi:hypothetical protein